MKKKSPQKKIPAKIRAYQLQGPKILAMMDQIKPPRKIKDAVKFIHANR